MSKDSGVSEVIGTLLLLSITFALFSVVFAWAINFRPPERAPCAELSAYLNDGGDGWGNGNERILIAHHGGELLLQDNIEVMITLDENNFSYKGKDLRFSNGFFFLGDVWQSTGERIKLNSTVYVSVIYHMESGALAILPEQGLIPTERAAGLPDLALYEDDVQYNPPLMEGQTIVIRANVKNLGRSDAGSFRVALYEGKETEGKMINKAEVKSLRTDDAKMVQLLYPSIPFNPAKETKEVTIVVDYKNDVPEGNEKTILFI
jgi:archaeal flagellin N-terminal-like domain